MSSAAAGDGDAEAVARANPAMGTWAGRQAGLGRPVTPTRASGGWVWSGLVRAPSAWGLMLGAVKVGERLQANASRPWLVSYARKFVIFFEMYVFYARFFPR